MKNPVLAIAILALLGAAHASNCEAPKDYKEACRISAFDDCSNASGFIVVAFMLVALAIALTYMYSKLKEDAAAGVWAKDEAFNLVVTVFLFVGLLVFFTGSCEIAAQFTKDKTGAADPFRASQNYIDRLISGNGLGVLRGLTADSLEDQKKATYYLYTGLTPFYGSGSAGLANYKALSAHKEFLMDLYLPMVASLNAQKYLLEALQWIGASVLLPFAFVMRLVPPTREFGNVLIALFFGTYIVVPSLYAMSGEAFWEIAQNPARMSGANAFYSYGIDGNNAGPIQKYELYKIGSTIPQAVFLPNLVLIVAITCTMAVSKALRATAV